MSSMKTTCSFQSRSSKLQSYERRHSGVRGMVIVINIRDEALCEGLTRLKEIRSLLMQRQMVVERLMKHR